MKNIFSIALLFIALFLSGCNSQKKHVLHQIKSLTAQIDSVNGIFQKINWQHWQELNDSISLNTSIIGEHTDLALKIDPLYNTYYKPYVTTGKVLTRILRKSKNEIDRELSVTKKQLENLENNINIELNQKTDSILLFIEKEHHAVEELIFEVSKLEIMLEHQLDTYKNIGGKANTLALKIKSINPAIGRYNKDIHYEEDQEQE